jgi:hypothetical protein
MLFNVKQVRYAIKTCEMIAVYDEFVPNDQSIAFAEST